MADFDNKIEQFLAQPKIAKAQFDAFKASIIQQGQEKDKEYLKRIFDSVERKFKNGYLKGPTTLKKALKNKDSQSKSKGNRLLAKSKAKSGADASSKSKRKKIKEPNIKPRKSPKYSDEYYRLKKLKQIFFGNNLTIADIADYYHYNQNWFLSDLKPAFKNIRLSDSIKESHLIYIANNLKNQLEANKKDKETIITKTAKTKPNYYKTYRG
ncbi:hypothetical protein J4E06_14340 [Muricauda sp. NFXS6]|uniref:hypothetical protein n=1 Tax=Allomuricauda sp. NFXS6 TaxID=2819094 RepID=UPI0032DF313F